MGDVGQGEAAKHRGVQDLARRLPPHGAVHDVLHGLVIGRLAQHVGQHGQGVPQHHGIDFSPHGTDQGFAGAAPGLAHIDVGVSAIAGDNGGVVDHDRRQVGMKIQGHGDGYPRCDGTDTAQQLALAVVVILGHHGTMQIQHDAVAAQPHGLANTVRHLVEGGPVHGARWIGIGNHGDGIFGPIPLGDIHEGRDGIVGAAI